METNSQDSNCDCHNIPTNTPGAKATRLDFKELDDPTKLQIQEFKIEIAKLYDKTHALILPFLEGEDYPTAREIETVAALTKSKEHLQLAAYYITHALTA